MSGSTFDAVVVGAGLAGAATAAVLARQGRRVALLDGRERYPRCFKAEKIEPDQADLLRELGIADALLPSCSPIPEVTEARGRMVLRIVPGEQYGIRYHDLVNCVRRSLPAGVDFRVARVADIAPGAEVSRVTLVGGEELSARLVVLAAGTGGQLHERLGLSKVVIRNNQSFACGFDVEMTGPRPVAFESLTYYPNGSETRIDYLTLFPVPGIKRANLFCYRAAGDDWVKQLARDPGAVLLRSMPDLPRIAGALRVSSKVEMTPIDLYRVDVSPRPGLVLIGDAFQSGCPTTGTGLSKVLTDVAVLCLRHVPRWFSTPGIGEGKIERFYADPRKTSSDRSSLVRAAYRRQVSTESTLRWRVHRERAYLTKLYEGWSQRARRFVAEHRGAAHADEARR